MENPQAALRQFFCSSCGVQLRAKAAMQGRLLPCPKCGATVTVPRFDSARSLDAAQWNENAEDTYAIRDSHSPPVELMNGGRDTDENAVAEEDSGGEKTPAILSARPQPPPWPLLQGVFSFWAQPAAWIYWFTLSLLGTFLFSLLLGSLALMNIPSPATWMGSVIFMSISFVLGMLFVVFNSINCLAILQESAAGNRVIEDWPGLMVFDLLGESLAFVNSVLIAVAVAWLITYPLAGQETVRAFCEFLLIILLFPILLLSMLEAGSFLLPASAAVWQSLLRSWRTWLMFYAESFLLAFAFMAYLAILAFCAARYVQDITPSTALLLVALGVGPGVFWEMVYFRLLGRLAWVCDEDSRRELAAAEEAEEKAEEQESETAGEIRQTPVDDF